VLRRSNTRHRLKHVATRLPPAGPHTDILYRNRRRHNNCSNLHQRRGEDTANDPNSWRDSPQGLSVAVQAKKYLLCSAAQLASCYFPAAAASRLTSRMLPHCVAPRASAWEPRSSTGDARQAPPRTTA
jgi:hypothetical protein